MFRIRVRGTAAVPVRVGSVRFASFCFVSPCFALPCFIRVSLHSRTACLPHANGFILPCYCHHFHNNTLIETGYLYHSPHFISGAFPAFLSQNYSPALFCLSILFSLLLLFHLSTSYSFSHVSSGGFYPRLYPLGTSGSRGNHSLNVLKSIEYINTTAEFHQSPPLLRKQCQCPDKKGISYLAPAGPRRTPLS